MPPTAETPTSSAEGATDPARNEKKKDAAPRADAESLGKQQREISVSEFFSKNRHLLGFDSPKKALLTTVKEAVDNSLDACEEAHILPDVTVTITAVSKDGGPPPPPAKAERFTVSVRDNGPGIVKEQIPRIFAKLLYGSKFHRLRQSRGQQGIGISAAGMYGQLTTMKPLHVVSKIGPKAKANSLDILIDTRKNEPIVVKKSELPDWPYERGTEVTIELEGRYQRGRASVEEYVELTTIANPHVRLTYVPPEGEAQKTVYERGVGELPRAPKEIRPHPYGIELGILHKMLQDTKSHWVSGFLATDFSRVSPKVAAEICEKAGLDPRMHPRKVVGQLSEKLYKAIQDTRLMAPPTDCLSPIGEQAILAGLYKQIRGDFYTAVTRPPAVYRGNPFVIEAGLAFGTGKAALAQPDEPETAETVLVAEGETKPGEEEVELARLIRYANRVPLLYQSSACATHKSVIETAWKNYGVGQSRGALPQGPLVIFVHMASAWVPFTSESKEAIADYDEIRKEIKLALQECGRRLGVYIRKREHAKQEFKRRNIFELYIEEVAEACHRLKKGKFDVERLKRQLQKIAEEKTGGEETDRLLAKKKEQERELPNSIVVTPEGPIGAPEMALKATGATPAPAAAVPAEEPAPPLESKPHAPKKTSPRKKKGRPAPRRDDGEKGKR